MSSTSSAEGDEEVLCGMSEMDCACGCMADWGDGIVDWCRIESETKACPSCHTTPQLEKLITTTRSEPDRYPIFANKLS